MAAPTVVVAGALANKPANGGEAWVRLSWIRGLQRLGCDVWFVEQIDAAHCVDGNGSRAPFQDSTNLQWFRAVTHEFGLVERSWLICDSGDVEGPPLERAADVAAGALLVNISGHLRDGNLKSAFRRRVYVDIDPGFTQIWDAQGITGARLGGHDAHFTIGANIGTPDCTIPTNGLTWHHVRPPVVLDDWTPTPAPWSAHAVEHSPRYTTVGTWRGPFGPLQFEGRTFGLKLHEFRKFIELPDRAAGCFEAALAIHPAETADRELLDRHGWHLVDPAGAAGTPAGFRDYVRGSSAEFSVAQGVYVDTCSGWFSDRTTRYLASGRPALVQDTGFSTTLPTGEWLVAFRSLTDAVRGAASIAADYEGHCDAAREIAAAHFGSDAVLDRFLDVCEAP
jgi:hypothetical protein